MVGLLVVEVVSGNKRFTARPLVGASLLAPGAAISTWLGLHVGFGGRGKPRIPDAGPLSRGPWNNAGAQHQGYAAKAPC